MGCPFPRAVIEAWGALEGRQESMCSREEQELPRDNNEVIVVGAVDSGDLWFLTGGRKVLKWSL